jgi:hypothetical protein
MRSLVHPVCVEGGGSYLLLEQSLSSSRALGGVPQIDWSLLNSVELLLVFRAFGAVMGVEVGKWDAHRHHLRVLRWWFSHLFYSFNRLPSFRLLLSFSLFLPFCTFILVSLRNWRFLLFFDICHIGQLSCQTCVLFIKCWHRVATHLDHSIFIIIVIIIV